MNNEEIYDIESQKIMSILCKTFHDNQICLEDGIAGMLVLIRHIFLSQGTTKESFQTVLNQCLVDYDKISKEYVDIVERNMGMR